MKKQQEIEISELVRRVWKGRKIVAAFATAALAVGLAGAVLSPVKYTAATIIVPQTGRNASGGNIQGLAAMAGLNIGAGEQGDLLSPSVYPMVAASTPFQKELMHTTRIPGPEGEATLLEWLSAHGRLPKADSVLVEYRARKLLLKMVAVRVDQKNSSITLSATMPEAVAAARLAERARVLLEEYVTRFKVQKAAADLAFIEARYGEVKADFEAKQRALANFKDANRFLSSAIAQTRETALTNEHNLAFTLYSELASQREQAGIKVKEDTPIFAVIEPVATPLERSAPRRAMILAASLLIGVVLGGAIALLFPNRTLKF